MWRHWPSTALRWGSGNPAMTMEQREEKAVVTDGCSLCLNPFQPCGNHALADPSIFQDIEPTAPSLSGRLCNSGLVMFVLHGFEAMSVSLQHWADSQSSHPHFYVFLGIYSKQLGKIGSPQNVRSSSSSLPPNVLFVGRDLSGRFRSEDICSREKTLRENHYLDLVGWSSSYVRT